KINKYIAKKQKSDLRSQTIDKNNQILRKQEILIALGNEKLEFESKKIMKRIDNRHREANKIAQEALEEIFTPVPESDYNIAEMQADLEDLLK
ncbi:MAG: cation diffusion facilitator family transporter, partial [Streptococcus lutetiensis]|nr:cation diffusion facilitator family transporter [Streptococcus lutetiensis]